ncbi:hypothetical protein [Massilia sp. TSP1-1-2]|uniref:hypothetical protein n=1 Tax=Massilia sp. TSP1-1-2 TaxID=2804649 RepID=UPI003CEE0B02
MRTWIKVTLLVLLAVGLSWGGAIWFWRATNRMPATQDLVLYLVMLPLALLLAFWLGRKLIDAIAAAPVAAAAAASAEPAAPPAPKAAPLALVAVSLRTAHGARADELSGAILEHKARAELDPKLVDEHGFPVMTARVEEADDAGLQEEVTEWFTQKGGPDLDFDEPQWRALVLATAVAGELASAAAGSLMPAEGLPPVLHLLPILPSDWTLEQRRAGGLWLQHVVSQRGWPLARIALAAEVPGDPRAASPSAVLGRLAHQGMLSGLPVVGMLVAGASALADASISKWEANNTLFTATRAQGLVPGEGAAGLLLTDLRQVQAIDGAVYAMLDLEADTPRHNSADEAKKADAKLLVTMTGKVLSSGGAEAGQVAMLVADTGHRTSRVLELMDMTAVALAHLDPDTDVVRVGGACGTCGAVPFVTALAVAHHHAIELAAPVLCISNEDPYRRSAVLVRPAAALS